MELGDGHDCLINSQLPDCRIYGRWAAQELAFARPRRTFTSDENYVWYAADLNHGMVYGWAALFEDNRFDGDKVRQREGESRRIGSLVATQVHNELIREGYVRGDATWLAPATVLPHEHDEL